MLDSKPSLKVIREEDVWVVRVERAGGKLQEYRCASEAQARQLELTLRDSLALG